MRRHNETLTYRQKQVADRFLNGCIVEIGVDSSIGWLKGSEGVKYSKVQRMILLRLEEQGRASLLSTKGDVETWGSR